MSDLNQIYTTKVKNAELVADPAQVAVIPEFDRIRAQLLTPVKKGFFRKAPEPPKGLYLWGGVGRGKSMIMDLFVESLADIPSRRVHFHAFMQEIHATMHEVRKTGPHSSVTIAGKCAVMNAT